MFDLLMKINIYLLSFFLSTLIQAQSKLDIIQLGHPTLRAKAAEVPLSEIKNPAFQQLIDDMIYTMKKSQGVGLAAPQVNHSLRMFVMKSGLQVPLTVVINPTIEYLEEFGQKSSLEGCLSIPGQTLKVPRYQRIRMSYWDRDGNYITEEIKGFKAIISQHEYDHLNGVLIVDLVQEMLTEFDLENYLQVPLM